MKLKIKRLSENAVIPKYAKPGDAALDITATAVNATFQYVEYRTGLACEIPEGHVGLLFPRSSVTNTTMMLKNSVGVIDSGYRGELTFRFYDTSQHSITSSRYKVGDRIGQLIVIPIPNMEIEEVTELSSTERGEGGYGSSGS